MCPISDGTSTSRRAATGMPLVRAAELRRAAAGGANAQRERATRVVPEHTAGSTAMATASEAEARVHGGFRRQVGGGRMAFAAALDRALLADQRLRDALDTAARQQAELATQLARVLALAHDAGPLTWAIQTAPDEGRATRSVATPAPTSLSLWEREVLRLLAAGQSNRRIAQSLFLSPRTVQRHVANVYLKIGTHCRAEATAYALDHGLR